MELKRYQLDVLENTKRFLDALARQDRDNRHASEDAWEAAGFARGYRPHRNGLGKDMPTFCIKVPTGGGKTLLATQILGQIYSTILRHRNGAGLALWIVPSDQIYKDTLKALRDRRHFYRESLEFAVGRRIEIWEKDEIARLTPTQLSSGLNVLLMKLAAANRETKEQLRMFQDSGGNIVQHFPPEDDAAAQRALKVRFPNLDMIDETLAKTSLGNLVRLCEPPVILDEGHKAYSDLARRTLEGFNSSIVVELSATPPQELANVLCRVSGQELLDEEMIKLPINVATSNEADWKTVLAKAKDKREDLSRKSARWYSQSGREIRPIVLVQVERVGKDQLEERFVHSEFVKRHLIERLGVPESEIAIKTSERDDIEGIDLLAEGCRVNWIITKQALQEGWDCPFAYILVVLNNTQAELSLTQLVGRVLRQPYARKTGIQELDESYVYCLRKRSVDIMREIKRALEKEGYEGDDSSIVDRTGDGDDEPVQKTFFRREFKRLYRPFQGKVYLPLFCLKVDGGHEGLDYFRHLLSQVDVNRFDYASIDWNLTDEMARARDIFLRIQLGQSDPQVAGQGEIEIAEDDSKARAWMTANLPYDHFSYRELRRVVDGVLDRLPSLHGKASLVKFILREKISGFIESQTDAQTQSAFKRLHRSGRLSFYLKCVECRFEIPPEIQLRSVRRLVHADQTQIERSLFDVVPEASLNEYEKEIALCLDRHPEVLWWYRNEVGPDNFSIQGYRKNRIFPDFVVQKGHDSRPSPSVLVVEGKGEHLVGSEDTNYKRDVAAYFERLGRSVTWQELGRGFENCTFRFQVLDQDQHGAWKDELRKMLSEDPDSKDP